MMDAFKPYLYAAFVFGGLAILGGIYAKGRLDATHAAQTQVLRDNIKNLEAAAERERVARVADTMQAKSDREDEEAAEVTIKELRDELKDRDRECFGGPDADRLRDLIEGAPKAKAPRGTK